MDKEWKNRNRKKARYSLFDSDDYGLFRHNDKR